jgi:hypothetical protein
MSSVRFTQLKYESFCKMVKNTQLFTEFCREYYRTKANNNYTPFINVLHDVWTKSNAEILGVSICFIDPKKFIFFRLAVGLQQIKTKNSIEVARTINNILGRINIVTEDIWRGINDNATAAKYVGRLISGGRIPLDSTSTCIMHSGNLVLEHALGTKIRTKNRQIVDSFKEGKDICKRIYSNFSWIMDKRIYIDLIDLMKSPTIYISVMH